MLTIEIQSIDKLHALLTELDVIAFLQHLVADHAERSFFRTDTFADVVPSARFQLLDWQADTLVRLRDLVHNKDFAHPVTENIIASQ